MGAGGRFYFDKDRRRVYVPMEGFKTMQDRTPGEVACSKCAKVIVSAEMAKAYRQRDLDEIVRRHRCQKEE